eukprot:381123_1
MLLNSKSGAWRMKNVWLLFLIDVIICSLFTPISMVIVIYIAVGHCCLLQRNHLKHPKYLVDQNINIDGNDKTMTFQYDSGGFRTTVVTKKQKESLLINMKTKPEYTISGICTGKDAKEECFNVVKSFNIMLGIRVFETISVLCGDLGKDKRPLLGRGNYDTIHPINLTINRRCFCFRYSQFLGTLLGTSFYSICISCISNLKFF